MLILSATLLSILIFRELYHSDVTYELQPPSLTSLRLVVQPETGGDTIFSSGFVSFSQLMVLHHDEQCADLRDGF